MDIPMQSFRLPMVPQKYGPMQLCLTTYAASSLGLRNGNEE